jgi:hypothetical protein
MFVENLFPDDPRVRNECETLSAAGYCITVVGLRHKGERFAEMVQGIQVYRLSRLSLLKKTPGLKPTYYSELGSRSRPSLAILANISTLPRPACS